MTKRELSALACRILAIITFIRVLETISYTLNHIAPELLNPSLPTVVIISAPLFLTTIFLQLSPLALLLMFALFLWTQADFFNAKMSGDEDENIIKINVNENTQAIAFSILGGYLLTQALPQIARMIIMFLTGAAQDPTWKNSEGPDTGFVIVQLALGLYLMFGTRGLIMLVANARHLGRDTKLQSQENDDDSVSVWPEK